MSIKPTHLLIGVGEVGSAIRRILRSQTNLYWHDINPKIADKLPSQLRKVDVLHVTIPQDKDFVSEVKKFIKEYSPELTVVHSTTIPGTVIKLGELAVHSPILGQHDDLYRHIKRFKKAVGPNSAQAASRTKKYLGKLFHLEFYENSQTTEAAKIFTLTRFALNIEMARYSAQFCKKLGIKYDEAVTKYQKLYNDGYKINKLEKFLQPILNPPKSKIGGSCVVPGVEKAKAILNSKLIEGILEKQSK